MISGPLPMAIRPSTEWKNWGGSYRRISPLGAPESRVSGCAEIQALSARHRGSLYPGRQGRFYRSERRIREHHSQSRCALRPYKRPV